MLAQSEMAVVFVLKETITLGTLSDGGRSLSRKI